MTGQPRRVRRGAFEASDIRHTFAQRRPVTNHKEIICYLNTQKQWLIIDLPVEQADLSLAASIREGLEVN
jgi:hypothetical protein